MDAQTLETIQEIATVVCEARGDPEHTIGEPNDINKTNPASEIMVDIVVEDVQSYGDHQFGELTVEKTSKSVEDVIELEEGNKHVEPSAISSNVWLREEDISAGISYVQTETVMGKQINLPPIIIRSRLLPVLDQARTNAIAGFASSLSLGPVLIQSFPVDDEAEIKNFLAKCATDEMCDPSKTRLYPEGIFSTLDSKALTSDEFMVVKLLIQKGEDGQWMLFVAEENDRYDSVSTISVQLGFFFKRGIAGMAASEQLLAKCSDSGHLSEEIDELQEPETADILPELDDIDLSHLEESTTAGGDNAFKESIDADVTEHKYTEKNDKRARLLSSGKESPSEMTSSSIGLGINESEREEGTGSVASPSGITEKGLGSECQQDKVKDEVDILDTDNHLCPLVDNQEVSLNTTMKSYPGLSCQATASTMGDSDSEQSVDSAISPVTNHNALSLGASEDAVNFTASVLEANSSTTEEMPGPGRVAEEGSNQAVVIGRDLESPCRASNTQPHFECEVSKSVDLLESAQDDERTQPAMFFDPYANAFSTPSRSIQQGSICSTFSNENPSSLPKDESTMWPRTPFKVAPLTENALLSAAPSPKQPRKPRARRCGQCPGCLIKGVCGECKACKVKPKFGGDGRTRQGCEKRRCTNMFHPERIEAKSAQTFASTLESSIVADVSHPCAGIEKVKKKRGRKPNPNKIATLKKRVHIDGKSQTRKKVRKMAENPRGGPDQQSRAKIVVTNIKMDLFVPREWWLGLDGEQGNQIKRVLGTLVRVMEKEVRTYISKSNARRGRRCPFRMSSNRDAFDFEPVPHFITTETHTRIDWCVRRSDVTDTMLATNKLVPLENCPSKDELFLLGCSTFLDVLDQPTLEDVEAKTLKVYENSRRNETEALRPGTYQHTFAARVGTRPEATVTRTKMFFGARYLWNATQLADGAAKEAGGIRMDVERPPRYTVTTVLPALYRCGALKENAIVNQVAINIYHTGTTGIAPHYDDSARFELPVTSIRIFSDSRLSFGCRGSWGIGNGEFQIPMLRNSVLVLRENSYASDIVKHCVRPCDMSGRSAVILFRKIHEKLLEAAYALELEDITERFANADAGYNTRAFVKESLCDLVRDVVANSFSLVTEPSSQVFTEEVSNLEQNVADNPRLILEREGGGQDLVIAGFGGLMEEEPLERDDRYGFAS